MWHVALQIEKLAKRRKRIKNADDVAKTRMVLEMCASGEELSPMDLTDVICFVWTRNGEIKSTGLLLATFNKLHILTY